MRLKPSKPQRRPSSPYGRFRSEADAASPVARDSGILRRLVQPSVAARYCGTMSGENVEVVARVYEAFARRDNLRPFEVYAPDMELDASRGMAEGFGGVYHGHDGVGEFFHDLLAAFSVIDYTVEEINDAGDRVIATVHERYVGRTSGVEVERRHYTVFTIRDDKITRMCMYVDPVEALEAAGLRG